MMYKIGMKRTSVITSLVFIGLFAGSAFADTRELTRNEIRENVRLGKSLSFSRVLTIVDRSVDGEVVDVRAFESGTIYYRILIKKSDGKLGAVILDAQSGKFM